MPRLVSDPEMQTSGRVGRICGSAETRGEEPTQMLIEALVRKLGWKRVIHRYRRLAPWESDGEHCE